ncbi:MAG: hypothetical protein ABMA15_19605 [Vicinamibacterales bacterium]
MRLILLLVTAIGLGAPAWAQETAVPSPDAGKASQAEDAGAQLPVSLDRIRDGLKKPQDQTLLHTYEMKPDFSVQIQEQALIDDLMSKLDFKSGPAPAGGLYSYEQQRRLFNPTDRPLQQPYAAFSGGELITIAIQNLIGRYIGSRAISAISSAQRSHAEAGARREVDQAVEEYCAQRRDRYEMQLCNAAALR